MKENEQSISWKALEHEHSQKDSDWFWALGIITISTAIVSIAFGNTAFAGLVIIASVTFALFAKKEPKEITFTLTEKGVVVENAIYLYTTITGFWIEDRYEDDGIADTLIFNTGKIFTPLLVISIPKTVSSEKIRTHLKQYLKETELHEPFFQKLIESVTL